MTQYLGAPASPSGSSLQPSVSAAIPSAKTVSVEDLHDLIFDPTLDAGIELQQLVASIIAERDHLLSTLKVALDAVNQLHTWTGWSETEQVIETCRAAIEQVGGGE